MLHTSHLPLALRGIRLASILLVVGCSAGAPTMSESDQAPRSPASLPSGVAATATVHVTTSSPSSLDVSVVLRNGSSSPTRIDVLAQVPMFVRLYRSDAAPSETAYDEGTQGATRLLGTIDIASGESRVLNRSVALADLRAAGVTAGRYRVEGVVTTAGGQSAVSAGTIDLP